VVQRARCVPLFSFIPDPVFVFDYLLDDSCLILRLTLSRIIYHLSLLLQFFYAAGASATHTWREPDIRSCSAAFRAEIVFNSKRQCTGWRPRKRTKQNMCLKRQKLKYLKFGYSEYSHCFCKPWDDLWFDTESFLFWGLKYKWVFTFSLNKKAQIFF